MRFPWSKQDEEVFVEEPKTKKKPETLKSVSERLIIKRMKRDESYGLKIAERVVGATDKDDKSLATQLKEYRDLSNLLKEIASSENQGQGSWIKELGVGFASAIAPYIAEMLQGMASRQSAKPQLGTQSPAQLPQARPQPKPEARQETPQIETEVEQTMHQPSLEDLQAFFELEPEEAVRQLKENHPEWLILLRQFDYPTLMEQVAAIAQENPEVEQIWQYLSTQGGREWLERVLELAKTA